MRGVCLLLLPLILLISLAGCGVFDNPLHLPEWGAEPPAFDLPGAAADEQGATKPNLMWVGVGFAALGVLALMMKRRS